MNISSSFALSSLSFPSLPFLLLYLYYICITPFCEVDIYAGINVIYEDGCGIGMQEKTIIVNKTWQHFFIFVLALADFMGALDATIVVISLPSIAHDFNAGTSMVSWVMIAYMLIIASFLLVFGKLGDLKGLKTVFIAGFVIFTLGSFLCGISGSISYLIIFRIIQGIGAAMFTAISPGMVPTFLPAEMRGNALGYVTTFSGLGLAVGPLIGGFISEYMT